MVCYLNVFSADSDCFINRIYCSRKSDTDYLILEVINQYRVDNGCQSTLKLEVNAILENGTPKYYSDDILFDLLRKMKVSFLEIDNNGHSNMRMGSKVLFSHNNRALHVKISKRDNINFIE